MSTQLAQAFLAPSQMKAEEFTAGSVSVRALYGTWKNTNNASRDIVEVAIAGSGGCIAVEAFGACTPTPRDWGSVLGIAYTSSASVNPVVAFTAQYIFSLSHVILIGHLHGKELRVECFTQFFDGSGRPNLYSADTLMQ